MAERTGGTGRRGPRGRVIRRLLAAMAVGGAAAGLFACYLRLSPTFAVGSDGASNALEAWDLLHGNCLLRGWTLTDISFYTTELPQYAVVELARGLHPDVGPPAVVQVTSNPYCRDPISASACQPPQRRKWR